MKPWKEVPLTKGLVAKVDAADFDRVMQFKWCASFGSRSRKYYAVRWVSAKERERWKSQKIRLGHFILDVTVQELEGKVIDHINDDSLDYRRENLQILTQEENMAKVPGWKKKGEPALAAAGPDRSDEW